MILAMINNSRIGMEDFGRSIYQKRKLYKHKKIYLNLSETDRLEMMRKRHAYFPAD